MFSLKRIGARGTINEDFKKFLAGFLATTCIFSSSLMLTGCSNKTKSEEKGINSEILFKKKDSYIADELSFINIKRNDNNQAKTYVGNVTYADFEEQNIDIIKEIFKNINIFDLSKVKTAKMNACIYNLSVHEESLYGYIYLEAELEEYKSMLISIDILQNKEDNSLIYSIISVNKDKLDGNNTTVQEFSYIYSLDNNELIDFVNGCMLEIKLTPFTDLNGVDKNDRYNNDDKKELELLLSKNKNETKSL